MLQMWARQIQQISAAQARTNSAAQARTNRRPQPQSNATEEIVLDGPAITSEVIYSCSWHDIVSWHSIRNSSSNTGDFPTETAPVAITPRPTPIGRRRRHPRDLDGISEVN